MTIHVILATTAAYGVVGAVNANVMCGLVPRFNVSAEQVAETPMNVDYCTGFNKMIEESAWCDIRLNGMSFILKTEKLKDATKLLTTQAAKDFPQSKLWKPPPFGESTSISFFDKNGKRTGRVGFWTDPGFVGGEVIGLIDLTVLRGRSGCLELNADTIERFLKDIKPAAYNFRNNCEALTSNKPSFVQSSLYAIVQEPFREQAKATIELIEPLLNAENADVKYTAAVTLLKLVPTHQAARRLREEELRKQRGQENR